MSRSKSGRYERYDFACSPWAQNLTQSNVAVLLGFTKTQLEALIRDKERWVRRETKDINGKLRELAIPTGRLRRCHEMLKFHFNKIKQPSYVFSPRKGRSQRDNAEHHVDQNQLLELDIRKFYPSTTSEYIFRWAYYVAGLRSDVAGLLTRLVVIDDRMPFGSPVSPILMSLVHRAMFDAIYEACQRSSVRMTLWVDNIQLSGVSVPGTLLEEIRDIVRRNGLQTHEIEYREAARPVSITGVVIDEGRVVAARSVHRRLKDGHTALKCATSDAERHAAIDVLLSWWGTYRYLVGPASVAGRKASGRMNGLRRRRGQLQPSYLTMPETAAAAAQAGGEPGEAPF